ncbi:cbb3-type cytochrome c oxidase subunit 3 [Rhizobium sp. PL01]|uniref:cbb3-type cytochrome c oxidase subunit 3 n=1 Tax=Rhizobium sp. PL01 TaxID=3085631 RepID=UPI0029825FE3|nr:cbb3-type cytochrome c oxidase subunit 3 [Rhizobium sp. PL01]MDW5317543.1 cbb3-type cytochrome c oxidase subunit 3 [Rhizobium sp. PL01]
MEFSHETLVGTAKSWGLFYLIGFSICVLIYTFWPSNKERFKDAQEHVFDKEDRPWT